MTLIRSLARPMLATPVFLQGLDVARHPTAHVAAAGPALNALEASPVGLPANRTQVVRIGGAVTAAAALMLATGKLPRLSALAIMATTPLVQPEPPFWKEQDPQVRRHRRSQQLTRIGLLGGVLLAAVDTEGNPGLVWRSRQASREASRAAKAARLAAASIARSSAHQAGTRAEVLGLKAERAGWRARRKAERAVHSVLD